MGSFDGETLARQLAQLGRDLQDEVAFLGELEEACTDAEGDYRTAKDVHEDCLAVQFLKAQGTAESRRAEARLACADERVLMNAAWKDWSSAKGKVSTQRDNLRALHCRVDIGRSLLSREKALISLAGVGEV